MPSLTDLSVRSLPQGLHFDSRLASFGIRVGKNKKTWIVVRGQNRTKVALGHYPSVSLQDARKKALAALASPEEQKATLRFPDALDAFLKRQAATLRPISLYQSTRILHRHFKWQKELSKISHEDVVTVLDGIKAPSERGHALKDLRTFFNWCIPRYLKISPCLGIEKPAQKSRERVLTGEELAKVWHQAKKIGHPYGTIVQLLILAAQRSGETAALRWDWINGDTFTIPQTVAKNGHATIVPIGPMAQAVIDSVPRDGDLLFPARGYDDKSFTGFGVSKIVLDQCGVKNFTHHDLRRTASTMWAELGVPQHINDRLLNHVTGGKQSAVARIYNRYEYLAEKREAILLWEKRVAELVSASA
ncbi:MAG: DUF4102 domain-containing protein [Bradyrhizobium sp.]|nr:MAG: DUF4102 domain-containing protein [Bradyrhizobium sp.]